MMGSRRLGLLAALCVWSLLLGPQGLAASTPPVLAPGQSATLLPDGQWLLVGGEASGGPVGTVSLWNPDNGSVLALGDHLHHPRAWHTATLLPDGTVLIAGGWGSDGAVLDAVERIDVANATVRPNPIPGLTARAAHSATLLTEGRILFAGGVALDGALLADAQLWDAVHQRLEAVAGPLAAPRAGHTAELEADGTVWLSGGVDQAGTALGGDRYHPDTRTFTTEPPLQARLGTAPQVTGSEPADGVSHVALDTAIAVRFSAPLDVRTLNDHTVFLSSANGVETAQVTPAEGGILVFVTPGRALAPGTEYGVTLNGPTGLDGTPVPVTELRFTTAPATGGGGAGPGGPGDGGGIGQPGEPGGAGLDWVPTAGATGPDAWRMNAPPSPSEALAPLLAPPGVTALAGQVLTLRGDPLPDVTLGMEGQETRTDATGRFLLAGVPAGRHELLIDGRTANGPGRVYGVFEVGVELADGVTTALPYTIWMPRIDTAHAVTFDSPTTRDVIATTPHILGLEVHIPANTVITDHAGRPVRQITITPIPVDRPPFPLAPGVVPPVYFTIQPGAGYVYNPQHQGVRLVYPNRLGWPGGERTRFWQYDPGGQGWHVYGLGRVTDDHQTVVPDPGVAIYEFTGAMVQSCVNNPNPPCPTKGGAAGAHGGRGEPVDTTTGIFIQSKTDLALPDVIPIALSRYYRSNEPLAGPFGIGTMHPYNIYLFSWAPYGQMDLLLPNGSFIHYVRISGSDNTPGSNVLEHTSSPTRFYKSRVFWNSADGGWNVALKDGTVLVFGEVAPLQAIRDRFGNQLTITRTSGQTGNITRITSPNGRWIEFSYDASNRVTQAADITGRAVTYTYDTSGRLATVTDPAGGVTQYTYDGNNRMLTITDPRSILFLTNEYNADGRVTRQTQADGTTFQLAYTVANGKVTQTDVTDPRGIVERLTFNADGYIPTDTLALGRPEQQTTTYTLETGSNVPLAVTDALGRQTTYTYDEKRNLTSVTRLAGTGDAVTTTYTYDPTFSQLTSVTDPLNHTTTFTYTSQGALATITDPLSQQTVVTTNTAGQTTAIRDPLNNTTQLGYDFGDLVSITDPLGNTTRRFVDGAGRLATVTDPLGRTTRYQYDGLSRLTQITDPKAGITSFSYDGNGNLLSVTDARSNTTSYTYNSMERLITRTDPLTRQESYQYDNNGNLTQFTDRKSQVTTYTYDAGNRLTAIAESVAGTISRTYDGLDRLTQEATPQGTVSYGYDAGSRRTAITVAGQPAIGYSYDTADRLTQISQSSTSVGFGYDADSRRTSLTLPNGIVIEFAYGTASRLTGLTYKLGMATLGTLTYTYDPAGSRVSGGGSWARTGMPAAVATSSYNVNNQQLGFGAATMSYDLNGNMAMLTDGSGTTTYSWNARDQLTALSGPGLSASFGYDGMGRRRTKTINAGRTDFLYDGLSPVQEGILPATPAANLLTGLAIDEYFIRTDAAGARHFLPDALGSTLALTDAAGAVSTEYTYEPFGLSTATGAASSNSFQFTGRESDGTGLYYYRARYYHPGVARFLNEDQIGFGGGDVNLYRYVWNNPLRYVDALGLWATNESDEPWIIKPESSRPFCVLAPGTTYPGPVDGGKPPRGPWFKVSTGTNITIGKGGTPTGSGGPLPPIFPDLGNLPPPIGGPGGLSDKLPGNKYDPGWTDRNPDWKPPAGLGPCEIPPPQGSKSAS